MRGSPTLCIVICSSFLSLSCTGTSSLGSEGTGSCGDGVIQANEACDGLNIGIATCDLIGQGPGTPTCSANCLNIENTGCAEPACGDGFLNGDEACDGNNFGDLTCTGVGYEAGDLTCTAECTLAFSACFNPSQCTCPDNWSGDGICDPDCNAIDCGWDEGDCCASTCNPAAEFDCGSYGFTCLDPNACENTGECSEPEPVGPDANGCTQDWFQDGYCDEGNNTEICEFDGGDCCPSSCLLGLAYECGAAGWDCVDPSACENTGECDPVPPCMDNWFGDGWCDGTNNTEECGYDNGDCCESTCQEGVTYTCGEEPFNCLDPSACENLGNCETPSPCDAELSGNSTCDSINNSETCEFDGGDCCPSTCLGTDSALCGAAGWTCLDPLACENTAECDPAPPCVPNWSGDGWCDGTNNVEVCNWDNGDCCASTCSPESTYGCDGSPVDCQDPSTCEHSSTGCF